jgi:hypothetical protein
MDTNASLFPTSQPIESCDYSVFSDAVIVGCHSGTSNRDFAKNKTLFAASLSFMQKGIILNLFRYD